MSLRKKIIRLAHAKPELRKHLLPLVVNSKTAMDKRTIKQIENDLNYEITLYDGNDIEFKRSFSKRGEDYLLFESPLLSYDENHPYVKEMESEGTGSYSAWTNNYGSRIEINWVADSIASAVDNAGIEDLAEYSDIKIKGSTTPDEMGYIFATVQIILKVVS